MVRLAELRLSMKRHDVPNFLRVYLKDVLSGEALTLPTSVDLAQARLQWEDALPMDCQDYSEGFIKDLAELWLSVVSKLDPHTTNVPQAALALLTYGDGSEPLTPVDQGLSESPFIGGNPNLKTVATQISASYYAQHQEQHSPVLSPQDKKAKLLVLMKKKKDKEFLLLYLSHHSNEALLEFPKSTVFEVIQEEWRKILHVYFREAPPVPFLQQLSLRWYYWMNRVGIPTQSEAVRSLCLKLKQSDDSVSRDSSFIKKSWLERFLNWFV